MLDFRKYIHKINNIQDDVIEPCSYGMDVVFMIDITQSMDIIIEEVKSSIGDIVDTIEAQVDVSDYRLGIVLSDEVILGNNPNYLFSSGYTSLSTGRKNKVSGISTDKYTTALEMLSNNNEASFTTQLNKLVTSAFPMGSGVDNAEPMEIGLQLLLTGFVNPLRGSSIVKYVLVFTDNPPGGDDGGGTQPIEDIMEELTTAYITQGIKVFVFGSNDPLWQIIATGTGGQCSLDYDGQTIIDIIEQGCQNA